MLYVYPLLFGVLVLALALLIDLGVGGLTVPLLKSVLGRRPATQDAQGAGDSWGTALGLVLALLVGFLAWGYMLYS